MLYGTWLKVFVRHVMAAFIPKICQIGFTYTQPFLVELGIGLAATPRGGYADNIGYGLIGAYAIVYTGIAVSLSLPSALPVARQDASHVDRSRRASTSGAHIAPRQSCAGASWAWSTRKPSGST